MYTHSDEMGISENAALARKLSPDQFDQVMEAKKEAKSEMLPLMIKWVSKFFRRIF